jgi:hypothetical protein
MKQDLEQLRNFITDATKDIAQEYFLLPVADREGGEPLVQYRERVYAYELYHQLRRRWPPWRYSLGGEVDKRRHPIIRDGCLKNVKPDLIVHVPRDMNHNLAVIEIKALPAEEKAVKTDLQKLIAFRNMDGGYAAAFLLVFGESVERVLDYGKRFRQAGINIDLVQLYHHRRPQEPAVTREWGSLPTHTADPGDRGVLQ